MSFIRIMLQKIVNRKYNLFLFLDCWHVFTGKQRIRNLLGRKNSADHNDKKTFDNSNRKKNVMYILGISRESGDYFQTELKKKKEVR